MTRKELVQQVENYLPFDQTEKAMCERLLSFMQENENCFERTLLIGHITASAWLLNEKTEEVLLIHHKKLNKWLQPGGHCDGDENVFRVARKEVLEETGIQVGPQKEKIFDIDIHSIPERKGVPEHDHYDVRFKFVLQDNIKPIQNEESNALEWISIDTIENYTQEPSILRMVKKCI